MFPPQSPFTHEIINLARVSFFILTLVCICVVGMLTVALMRYRSREGEAEPRQIAGNKRVEIVWTAIPLAIVILLFVLTGRTMSLSDPPPAPTPDLIVIGHQWWWEAQYPKSGVVTANEIHIPVGQPISIRLDSTDVLHEFWVAQLTRKMTAVPGHPNSIWLQADKPGSYLGLCSEFCGTQHAWMRFVVIAESPAEFAAWEKAQLLPSAPPKEELARHGEKLFEQHSCINCHSINGVKTGTQIGPDLTHFATRKQFGAGIVDNTAANVSLWLHDPQRLKPGVLMPDFKLDDEEVTALTSFLETLK